MYSSAVVEAGSLKSRCQQGSPLSADSRAVSFLDLPTFQRLQTFLDIAPISACDFTGPPPPCLCLVCLLKRQLSLDLGPKTVVLGFRTHSGNPE